MSQVPLTTSSVAVKPPRPWWVAFVCGMASYIDIGVTVALSTVLVIYQGAIGLSPADVGLLTGLFGLGIAIGAVVGGRLGDRIGRRKVFTATMVVIIVGIAIMMFSSAVPVMVVGVLVMGLGTGADMPVALSSIVEAARNDKQRGRMIAFTGVLVAVGGISASIVGGFVGDMGVAGAQILLGQLGVVTIIVLALRMTIPESSTWLLAQAERKRGIETIRADRSSVRDLFRAPYRTPFIALILFYSFVIAAGVPFGQYATYLLVNVAGATVSQASLTGLIAIPVALIAIIVTFLQLGTPRLRFPLFTIGAAMLVLSPVILLVFGLNFTTYVIMVFPSALGTALAGEAIMKFWTARAFPTLLRTTAQGAVLAVGRFAAAAFAVVVPPLIALNVNLVFISMILLGLAGTAIAWVVFRTRDKHSEFDTENQLDPEADLHSPAASASRWDASSLV